MVSDLVNAEGGAKIYTIKGKFGIVFAFMARIDAIVI